MENPPKDPRELVLSSIIVDMQKEKRFNFKELYPWQRSPLDNWFYWILYGGRGIGKTGGGAQWAVNQLREYGKDAVIGVGAPTRDDVRVTCADGKSGIMTLFGDEFKQYNKSSLEAWHMDGGYLRFMGMEEPGRWNGPNWTHLWIDEFGLINIESWDMALLGLRLPPDPRVLLTFTPKKQKPKNLRIIKELLKDKNTVVTHGKTIDAIHLDDKARGILLDKYKNTRTGRQELEGEILDKIEGALWQAEWIDDNRAILNEDGTVTKTVNGIKTTVNIVRKVVAVDPSGGSKPTNAETGIAVVGLGDDGDVYVFGSNGYRVSPARWGEISVLAYHNSKADLIIGETNFGGDMVIETIQRFDRNVKVEKRTASRGKVIRATPCAMLYEQGRVHHCDVFEQVEDQMCSINENGEMLNEDGLKDQLDAVVWGILEVTQNISLGGGFHGRA